MLKILIYQVGLASDCWKNKIRVDTCPTGFSGKVNFYFNSRITCWSGDIPDGGDNVLYRKLTNFFRGTPTRTLGFSLDSALRLSRHENKLLQMPQWRWLRLLPKKMQLTNLCEKRSCRAKFSSHTRLLATPANLRWAPRRRTLSKAIVLPELSLSPELCVYRFLSYVVQSQTRTNQTGQCTQWK